MGIKEAEMILGIQGTNYDEEQVKKAYREQVKIYHPDNLQSNSDYFIRLNEAQELLKSYLEEEPKISSFKFVQFDSNFDNSKERTKKPTNNTPKKEEETPKEKFEGVKESANIINFTNYLKHNISYEIDNIKIKLEKYQREMNKNIELVCNNFIAEINDYCSKESNYKRKDIEKIKEEIKLLRKKVIKSSINEVASSYQQYNISHLLIEINAKVDLLDYDDFNITITQYEKILTEYMLKLKNIKKEKKTNEFKSSLITIIDDYRNYAYFNLLENQINELVNLYLNLYEQIIEFNINNKSLKEEIDNLKDEFKKSVELSFYEYANFITTKPNVVASLKEKVLEVNDKYLMKKLLSDCERLINVSDKTKFDKIVKDINRKILFKENLTKNNSLFENELLNNKPKR